MIPKEKAHELFNKFCYEIRTEERGDGYFTNVIQAKQCALIAVDEMMNVYASALHSFGIDRGPAELIRSPYLEAVKEEIKKL